MRIHSNRKIKQLRQLRRTGHSIHEIMDKLDMPKTTVWHHVQKVEVLSQYQTLLKKKRGGGNKRKIANIEKAVKEASSLFSGTDRDLLIALAMLYWAEGSKGSPEFINSDGRMIFLYLQILRNVLNIPDESIHVTIRIFTGMDRGSCLKHWSQVTKISSKVFTVRLNDGGTRGRTEYGLCRIGVRKGGHFLKLMHALIDESFDYLIK